VARERRSAGRKVCSFYHPAGRATSGAARARVAPSCLTGIPSRLAADFPAAYHRGMDTLSINISWEFFLGVMGSLIALAYYANGRFTGLETNVDWLKETISELLINAENVRTKMFKNGSPVSLTTTGYHVLARSGLRSYVDANRHDLVTALSSSSNQYELQRKAFQLFAELRFEDPVARHLHDFAFANGVSTDLLRRIAAIYLRDLASGSN
jgi:hypothetical protein